MVDDGLALAELGQREAGLARVGQQLLLGVEHGLGQRRLAGDEAQILGRGRREGVRIVGEVDRERAEAVARAGRDVEPQHGLGPGRQPLAPRSRPFAAAPRPTSTIWKPTVPSK